MFLETLKGLYLCVTNLYFLFTYLLSKNPNTSDNPSYWAKPKKAQPTKPVSPFLLQPLKSLISRFSRRTSKFSFWRNKLIFCRHWWTGVVNERDTYGCVWDEHGWLSSGLSLTDIVMFNLHLHRCWIFKDMKERYSFWIFLRRGEWEIGWWVWLTDLF